MSNNDPPAELFAVDEEHSNHGNLLNDTADTVMAIVIYDDTSPQVAVDRLSPS